MTYENYYGMVTCYLDEIYDFDVSGYDYSRRTVWVSRRDADRC